MAVAARESRRMLAVDVRGLVWQEKKFDAERFIRTGSLVEWGHYEAPDTPALRKAKADIKLAREQRKKAGGD
jgi:hypothetical protein